jgi:hypothetical protein
MQRKLVERGGWSIEVAGKRVMCRLGAMQRFDIGLEVDGQDRSNEDQRDGII